MAQFEIYIKGKTEDPQNVIFYNNKDVEMARIERSKDMYNRVIYLLYFGKNIQANPHPTYCQAFKTMDAIVLDHCKELGYDGILYNSIN